MSEGKYTGQWASETYDFIRLFRGVGKSIFGLFLLELGWILLLMLISRIQPTGDTAPAATVSLPGGTSILVTQLLIPGMIVVFVVWFVRSGLSVYLTSPLYVVVDIGKAVVILIYLSISGFVNLMLLPISSRIEEQKIAEYMEGLEPETRDYLVKNRTDLNLLFLRTAARSGDREMARKQFGKKVEAMIFDAPTVGEEYEYDNLMFELQRQAYREVGLEGIDYRKWQMFLTAYDSVEGTMSAVFSQLNIGIAPITGFNYDEEQSSERLETQVFSTAIEWIQASLRDIDALQHVRFHILPEHIAPRNAIAAGRLRRWLNFDVLFWGSYLAGSTSQIWINTSIGRRPSKQGKKDKQKSTYQVLPEVFLNDFKIDPSVLVIDQNQPWDAYAILGLAIILSMQSREPIAGIERLSYRSEMDQIILHLLRDVFLNFPEDRVHIPLPDLVSVMVELSGNWIGYKIGDYSSEENVSFVSVHGQALLRILEQCILKEPTVAENYYRAGALACHLRRADDAQRFFESAAEFEATTSVNSTYPQMKTNVEMGLLSVSHEVGQSLSLAVSKLAAHIARAINVLDPEIRQTIREQLESDIDYSVVETLDQDDGEIVAFGVIRKLLQDTDTSRLPNP